MQRPRWGDAAQAVTLPPGVAQALQQLGAVPAPPPMSPESVPPLETSFPSAARTAIEAIVGTAGFSTDPGDRFGHTRGYSTSDLLRLRTGDVADAPDAVVFPRSHDEVLGVLRACGDHRIVVTPFAGGTSVVGGLVAERGPGSAAIALDLRRLNALRELDEESHLARFDAGMRGVDAESDLAARGFTLGHFPQSFEGASLGGYAATRSAGQASAGYGRFDDMVMGLVLATPRGTVTLGRAPASAAGPDLRELILGSEGAFGVITEVTLRVRRAPEVSRYEGWHFGSFAAGSAALRGLVQGGGPMPSVIRLSDETESAMDAVIGGGASVDGESDDGASVDGASVDGVSVDGVSVDGASDGDASAPAGGCRAIIGYAGNRAQVAACREATAGLLAGAGGRPLGEKPGEKWNRTRYQGPYLRDALLDAGALVETLETATFWSGLAALRVAVTEAITAALTGYGTPPIVMCHLSHVYETGASLYFTVVCAQADDPVAQWQSAKLAAVEAIRSAGGTISHHHGVGIDHRAGLAAEIGPLMVEALQAVKRVLDPAGIMNPGVLLSRD
jgi:alkyldihydroxyacetonephosphate synthase